MQAVFDIAVIGGGINGTGIARDAAGRGWSVLLAEKSDLGGATSASSTKLVHGGLRYLEHYEFRLVREALQEREVLWGIAPHIIWPLRFVLPHHPGLRPAWLLRLGLFLYDHIGGRQKLPATTVRRLDDGILKPEFTKGFEYSDCWVEDSRLVVLNARDAAERGADIRPRTEVVSANRADGLWQIVLRDADGVESTSQARTLVNAAGPWVAKVLGQVVRANTSEKVRLVQGSHIIVPRLYEGAHCYIFQNADQRIFFAIPYETDFTLIGTTDRDYQGDPAQVHISSDEIDYLCKGASDYFAQPVTPDMVVWTYSGVRPLYDDGASAAQEATRDYVLTLDAPQDGAAMLSVFGGKITTYRRLALSALERLAPHLPKVAGLAVGWTGMQALPGGDLGEGFFSFTRDLRLRYPFLSVRDALRLARAYGSRAETFLKGATSMADLGTEYGAGLTEAELRYLVAQEWVRRGDDVLWRRSKLGLRLDAAQRAAVDAAVVRIAASG